MAQEQQRPLNVLIAGGGIAGPALAFWLARAGHRVTIVERYPALRATGAQVDLRGQGIDSVRAMGLLDEVRAHLVHEPGVAFVDPAGRQLGAIMANTSGTGRQTLTSEFEIMRGDLVRILHDATKNDVEYRFGLSVDGFDQAPDRVTAHFSDGSSGDFDVLVGADGQGSRTRRALLAGQTGAAGVDDRTSGAGGPGGAGGAAGAEPYWRTGLHMAYWFVPRIASDGDLRETYAATGGRQVMRRSHNPDETQAYFVLRETSDEASAIHRAPVEEQQRFWAERFRGAGWQSDRFVDGMADAPFFYSQEVLQVRTDTWSDGRVVLLGDAAHCASPYSGMGISGGLVGAYVLAGELTATPDDLPGAFRRYDATLRPFVDEIQAAVKPRLLALGMPRSRVGVVALRQAFRIATALRIPERIAARATTDRGGEWALPSYAWDMPEPSVR
jgi:2-polyprenyl-6-methoxyphenol hydroxylase-like FAD-dependent oxidoreductase